MSDSGRTMGEAYRAPEQNGPVHPKVMEMATRAVLADEREGRKPAAGANAVQHGGIHYKKLAIQHWDYVEANGIPYLEACAIKYLTRWRDKGGLTDLRKAIHYIEKRIELEEAKPAPSLCPHPDTSRILIQTVAGNGWRCDLCGHKESN